MMEKLNELVYRAEGYLLTKAESQPEQINVSCKTILAIAEAFRTMEKRAEAAEAKLAELEKPKTVYALRLPDDAPDLLNLSPEQQTEFNKGFWYGIEKVKRLNTPAPAADLAELVPEEIKEKDLQGWFIGPDGKRWSSLEVAGYNKCLVHILSNIKPE